jgi:hypothetical protein
MPLVFVRESHQYFMDDRELVSVTRVMGAAGMFKDEWFSAECRDRGARVHAACCRLDDGLPVTDPIAQPYVAAYLNFKTDLGPVWSHVESPVYDEVLGYAGTLDRAGVVGGQKYVIDLKTGEVPPSVGPQTAAYARCLLTPYEYTRAALQLRPDGVYRFERLTDRQDERVFLAALLLWQWKTRHLKRAV